MKSLALIACFVAAIQSQSSGVSPESELASAIRNAYRANLSELPYGAIRFSFTEGIAPSIDEALKGSWTKWSTASGLLIFDGNLGRYERIHPPEGIVKNREVLGRDRWRTWLFPSIRTLTNGEITLSDGIDVQSDNKTVFHVAQIDKGVETYYPHIKSPLMLGNPESDFFALDRDISKAAQASQDWELSSIDETAELDGISCAKLTFTFPGGRREYWVDLERGAVPLQIRHEGGPIVQVNYYDIKQVNKINWLPMRMLTTYGDPSASVKVNELNVTDCEFSQRPGRDQFRLEFPSARKILDTSNQVVYGERKIWDLSTLPRPGSPGAQRYSLVDPDPEFPALPGEAESKGLSTWMILCALGLILLLFGGYAFLKRRRDA